MSATSKLSHLTTLRNLQVLPTQFIFGFILYFLPFKICTYVFILILKIFIIVHAIQISKYIFSQTVKVMNLMDCCILAYS